MKSVLTALAVGALLALVAGCDEALLSNSTAAAQLAVAGVDAAKTAMVSDPLQTRDRDRDKDRIHWSPIRDVLQTRLQDRDRLQDGSCGDGGTGPNGSGGNGNGGG